MNEISTKKIGLAAFIMMNGGKFKGTNASGALVFETEKTEQAWSLDYSNSDCSRHDALVCNLRDVVRTARDRQQK